MMDRARMASHRSGMTGGAGTRLLAFTACLAAMVLATSYGPALSQQELKPLPWGRDSGPPPRPVPPDPQQQPGPPAGQPTAWKALLVAGDDAQHVFTNAVGTLHRTLTGFGVSPADIGMLTADARSRDTVATFENLAAQTRTLAGAANVGCFVYMTSHGQRDGGLYFRRSNGMLPPAYLDQVLDRGCGDRPTVVITSGCYSGLYVDTPAMRRANRIVLTAARSDRTSFGCSNDYQYTFYDHCFLDALRRGAPWTAITHRIRACVERREEQVGAIASFPQNFFGSRVAALTAF
jgi:hypothetical protein